MQRISFPLLIVVILGTCACVYSAHWLRDRKAKIAGYEMVRPTMFYAGLDKFLSGVNWMTLIQWQAANPDLNDQSAELLYRKFNALTNLDPLFYDAYLNGALALAPHKPELAKDLIDKGMQMGLGRYWKLPFYGGLISLIYLKDPWAAEKFLEAAAENAESPDYVHRALVRARAQQSPGQPLVALKLWIEYFNKLSEDDQTKQLSVVNEILISGQEFVESTNSKLQEEVDSTKREQMVKDRDQALAIMASVRRPGNN